MLEVEGTGEMLVVVEEGARENSAAGVGKVLA